MGACASVQKGMKEEATAPPPEPAKEETTTEVPQVPALEEKKAEESAPAEAVSEKQQSLTNSLFNERIITYRI